MQLQHLYIGMRWGSAPDGVKSHDFQYWWPLSVADVGVGDGGPSLVPMQWADGATPQVTRSNAATRPFTQAHDHKTTHVHGNQTGSHQSLEEGAGSPATTPHRGSSSWEPCTR